MLIAIYQPIRATVVKVHITLVKLSLRHSDIITPQDIQSNLFQYLRITHLRKSS